MSDGFEAPPRPAVIRRRVRQEQIITLPEPVAPPPIPHAGRHAQTFVVALLLVIVAGAALLATPWTTESGRSTPFIDALFTAVSATAVTGLVTVDTADHWNAAGEAIILILIQAGGLGFMVGASIVFQMLRRGPHRLRDLLLVREGAPQVTLREAVALSRRITIFTFAVEGAGALALTAVFWREMSFSEALWQGVFHAVSAFCNAGFDLQGGFLSLAPHRASLPLNLVIMALIQSGALSYIALEEVVRERRWARFSLDTKLVLLINALLLLLGTAAFAVLEWGQSLGTMDGDAKPLAAAFQSVAARTAGFATVNFSEVRNVTIFLWIGVMFIGGAAGSTAGGVKLATAGVVVMAVVSTLRGREEPQLFRRRVATALVFRAMAVIAIMLVVHFIVTVALAVTEDVWGGRSAGFLPLMFEAMSALATVGLTTGITPSLTTGGKLVLCAAMFFGRIGPLTAAYALQRRSRPPRYRFPLATVRIG